MGLQYISHNDIDFKKWDEVVKNSESGLIYSLSFYLDVVTHKSWDALILDDYRAVVALPINRKLFGIPQLFQPPFTQQLGLLGDYTPNELELVHSEVEKKFRRISYPFHFSNAVSIKKKTNLIIDLNRSYADIEKGFSSSLRKRLRKTLDVQIQKGDDVNQLVSFYKEQLADKVSLNEAQYSIANSLFTKVLENELGFIRQVKYHDEIMAIGMFLRFNNRIINVFGASVSSDKFPNAMAVLIASVLRENANSNQVFDFEGSEISGVQTYFQSFGSVNQDYPVLEVNRLPFWVKMLLKLRR